MPSTPINPRTRRSFGAVVLTVAVAIAGCTAAATTPSTDAAAPTSVATTTTVPVTTTTITEPTRCIPGPGDEEFALRIDSIVSDYNVGNANRLVATIGDGPVYDPSLRPELGPTYATIADWLAAADEIDDVTTMMGYGPGEPVRLFVERKNDALRSAGIDSLAVTFQFWTEQDCTVRVETTDVISAPDPCRYHELYGEGVVTSECSAPFEPRAGHASIWTGEEVLIYGGASGTHESPPLRTGLSYKPEDGTWRELAPSPVELDWWPTLHAVWAGDRMLVVGRTVRDEAAAIVVLSYVPDTDTWVASPSLPAERTGVGAAVWTGAELILVGGDTNYPENSAWGYNPATDAWRQLPDPEIIDVEGIEGVWTGTQALFYGGYGAQPGSPAIAYNPETDSWRDLADAPSHWTEGHRLSWTGEQMIVYSGHLGPEHATRLLLYDPAADAWIESAPLPITSTERLAAAWMGDALIVWGGLATYGEYDDDGDAVYGDGASYDPTTDTWTVLAPSPLSDRCDHSGTWTGELFVVFGGMTTCGDPNILADGNAAAYDPDSDSWMLLDRP